MTGDGNGLVKLGMGQHPEIVKDVLVSAVQLVSGEFDDIFINQTGTTDLVENVKT